MKKWLYSLYLFPTVAAAELMTDNLAQPADIVANFMWKASIIIGAALLFAALLKYLDYRVNKNASPLNIVLILFISGSVLTLFPLADSLVKMLFPYFFNFISFIKSVIQQWI